MPWFVSSGSKKEDHTVCPTCGNRMTVLFTSAVCDRCDPPDGVVPLEWWEEFSSKPVYHLGWNNGTSTPASHVNDSRFVALYDTNDVASGKYADVYFFKYTVNAMGSYVLNRTKSVSAKCLQHLDQWGWDRGNPVLEAYFFKIPSRFNRIVYMAWRT